MRRRITLCASIAIVAVAPFASAFEADGFRSGMSIEAVGRALASDGQRLGRPLSLPAEDASYVAIVEDKDGAVHVPDLVRAFAFCHSRLVSYSHNLDFDADYASVLQEQLDKYGRPSSVQVDRQPFTGPGGGLFVTVRTRWYIDDQRVELSFSPEGRTTTGALRYVRTANLNYSQKNDCWERKYW